MGEDTFRAADNIRVNRIFYSCQGEGVHVGIPMVFVRLQGCNLNCNYCDTEYAQDPKGGEVTNTVAVRNEVQGIRSEGWVAITGGEPLCQISEVHDLVMRLRSALRPITLETNGSFPPPTWFKTVDSWCVDVKCPSSGSYGTFNYRWLSRLRKRDQLKFVVGTGEDLDFVKGLMSRVVDNRGASIKPTVLVSPMAGLLVDKQHELVEEYWNRSWLQEVWEFCCENDLRFSLQVHKAVWGDKRGV